MKYSGTLLFVVFSLCALEESDPRTFLLEESGSLGGESQRWHDIHTVLSGLGYQEMFDIKIARITEPSVSLEQKKIFVPEGLNTSVDQDGVTAGTKFEILKAFGMQVTKDRPFSYFVTRPRVTTTFQKGLVWGLFIPFAVTTLVGAGYSIAGLNSQDPEYYKEKTDIGITCLGVGAVGTLNFAERLLGTYGVEIHVTNDGKQRSDATAFAIEHLPKEDLEKIAVDLNRKRCAFFKDGTVKSLIAAQLTKLEREQSDPV